MNWIAVAVIGAVLGAVVSFGSANLRMPQSLTILIGAIGALAGGFIAHVTNFLAFGAWTFYVAGMGLSIALLAGGILAFSLTNEEKRI